jgi:hypothetical protein
MPVLHLLFLNNEGFLALNQQQLFLKNFYLLGNAPFLFRLWTLGTSDFLSARKTDFPRRECEVI